MSKLTYQQLEERVDELEKKVEKLKEFKVMYEELFCAQCDEIQKESDCYTWCHVCDRKICEYCEQQIEKDCEVCEKTVCDDCVAKYPDTCSDHLCGRH